MPGSVSVYFYVYLFSMTPAAAGAVAVVAVVVDGLSYELFSSCNLIHTHRTYTHAHTLFPSRGRHQHTHIICITKPIYKYIAVRVAAFVRAACIVDVVGGGGSSQAKAARAGRCLTVCVCLFRVRCGQVGGGALFSDATMLTLGVRVWRGPFCLRDLR